ncbi:hypothetical protein ACLK1S_19840 [Escherichia coli]
MLPDCIETGSPVGAVAIRRKIICRNAQPDTLDAVLAKLRDAGADISLAKTGLAWICMANVEGR